MFKTYSWCTIKQVVFHGLELNFLVQAMYVQRKRNSVGRFVSVR